MPRTKRLQLSKNLIIEALLILLENTSLDKITISLLCKTATVSRNTFYRHFKDVEAVLIYVIDEKIDTIIGQFDALEKNFDPYNIKRGDLERIYSRFYCYWEKESALMKLLYSRGLFHLFRREFRLRFLNRITVMQADLLSESYGEHWRDYLYDWQSGVQSTIMESWASRGCVEDAEQLVAITLQFNHSVKYQE